MIPTPRALVVDIHGAMTQIFNFQLNHPLVQAVKDKQLFTSKVVGQSKCKCRVN